MAAIAGLSVIIIMMTIYIFALNKTIEADKMEISTLTAMNQAFKVSVENQNKALEDIKEKDRQLAKKAASEIAKAHIFAESHKKIADLIIGQKVNGSDCEEANRLLVQYMKGSGL